MYEYKVDQVRSTLVGDKMDTGDLEKLLNERAEEGWTLQSVVEATVKGRVGPGGTEGLIVVFYRQKTG